MHSAGENRGRPKNYVNDALETIKQDITPWKKPDPTIQGFAAQRFPSLNGRGDAPEYHHAKPPMEPPPSASPSPSPAVPQAAQLNGHVPKVLPAHMPTKLNRKPSIERDLPLTYLRCSPALDSGAGSSRSDSPHSHQQVTCASRASTGQYSPSPSSFSDIVPPAPPPRNPTSATSATPPPPPPSSNQLYKRRSPATTRPAAITPSPMRGTSPVIPQNGIKAQQLSQQMKVMNLYPGSGAPVELPSFYPVVVTTTVPPPSYTASMQSRQSPTQSQSDYRKSPSSGIYSATSAGSPSPITVTNATILPLQANSVARPQPRVFQSRTQQPIIMQSVKSTQVQKPVLQTAVAPQSPVTASACNSPVHILPASPSYPQKSAAVVQQQQQQQAQQQSPPPMLPPPMGKPVPPAPTTPPLISAGVASASLNGAVVSKPPSIEPPSYAKSMQAKAAQHQQQHQQQQQAVAVAQQQQQQLQAQLRAAALAAAQQQKPQPVVQVTGPPPVNVAGRQLPPPPPYQSQRAAAVVPGESNNNNNNNMEAKLGAGGGGAAVTLSMINNNQITNTNLASTPPIPPAKNINSGNGNGISNANNNTNCGGNINNNNTVGSGGTMSSGSGGSGETIASSSGSTKNSPAAIGNGENCKKIKHASPIPERKKVSKEKEEERKECRIRQYSPQAYKFYMEQHIENVLKSYKQRTIRKHQLEMEMNKIGLPSQTQVEMRKMLNQKESNYIRLKRAKMNKSMFVKIKPIGVGAFGEVTLVRKIDTTTHLYAMKTLRKADVLKRNQVAHVKAERDILAEADNNWVVKLYYSFQDKENLYFVMDYIPGGDLMSLLIKKGIFEEPLAKFYIAELTCAVESVHKMGFIHRDIKPDNILIDRDGHIKLTDFGLCTGFRWTHNSKYYQENGNHSRQDSMEPWEDFSQSGTKPTVLERRRLRDHQRVLAHSLVGTPNYIAPEVLVRSGYTQLCDWWSVGVILYEMLVGQPPFLANTPEETQQKVINWESTLHIPPQAKLSREATDLIRRLCSSADKRLGKKADEVKAHDFFKGVDFADMRKQKAPYIPKIEHPTDTSNFDPIDPDKLRSNDSNLSGDELNDTARQFHGFYEFTFRRFFDDRLHSDMMDDQSPVYV